MLQKVATQNREGKLNINEQIRKSNGRDEKFIKISGRKT
jgi:hypothetical protein